MSVLKRFSVICLAVALAGCETLGGWFDDEEVDTTAPVKLQKITEKVRLKSRWSTSVGNGQGEGFYHINPLLVDGVVYAASADGVVKAVDADNGRERWEVELEKPLSGGISKYGDALYLGGADGLVLKLDANDGSLIWEVPVSGEVLAAPQSNGSLVVVQTYDGHLLGLADGDGASRWNYTTDVPVLTLRGTSTPIIIDDMAVAGFADGRVVAIDLAGGNIRWEVRVAIPEGRSEIEQIVDIDGTMARQGDDLFVASYHGRLAAIDVRSGRRTWQRNVNSFSGVSVGFGNVYVSDEDGTVSAYLRNGQGLRWQNIELGYRELSRPTPVSSYVAMVDFEGYLHLMSQVDGVIVGRTRTDSDGARADLIASGNRLYVFGNSGDLIAYDLESRE